MYIGLQKCFIAIRHPWLALVVCTALPPKYVSIYRPRSALGGGVTPYHYEKLLQVNTSAHP